ncbi:MAG: hypothetical protein RLZZ241_1798 [Bacteroidota bacterium]|jgi:cytochrome c biogenesis protein CcdA
MGMVWFIWFWIQLLFAPEITLVFGWLFISLLYLGTVFYQYRLGYLKVKFGEIAVISPIKPKKMAISEIRRAREFAGDIILSDAQNKSITINTLLLNPNDRSLLKTELIRLNVQFTH